MKHVTSRAAAGALALLLALPGQGMTALAAAPQGQEAEQAVEWGVDLRL
ncbi:MAG: hypothetical protein IJU50_08770 [Lachnospiraceae bacterium]|nr:hypothetical protein [Lachnospiraceae bacterium]